MSIDPYAHGTPVGDSHMWVRPASPACPDCECCSAALCKLAKEKNSACHWHGRSSDFDLSQCPCWRTDPPPPGEPQPQDPRAASAEQGAYR